MNNVELEYSNKFVKRLQIIPALLNILLVSLIEFVLIDNSNYWDQVNIEGQRIFIISLDYVLFISILGFIIGGYCIFYLILTFKSPEYTQIPIVSILIVFFTAIIEFFLIIILFQNEMIDVFQIYNLIGVPIDIIAYLILFSILLFMTILIIYKFPLLWKFYSNLNLENDKNSRNTPKKSEKHNASMDSNAAKNKMRFFRKRLYPKFILVLITIWFLIFGPFLGIITLQHPRLIFWEYYFSLFQWNSIFVYIHISMFIISLFSIIILIKIKSMNSDSIGSFAKERRNLIFLPLLAGSLIIQIFSLIILGLQQSYILIIYNPLFLMTLSLFLLFFGRFLQLKRFKVFWNKLNLVKKGKTKLTDKFNSKNRSRVFLMLIVILPISWICFYQPMFTLMPRVIPDPNDVKYVQNSYEDLTLTQKTLFDEFLEDQLPIGSNISTYLNDTLRTRTAIRVASGLLYRDHEGDIDKSIEIIEWLLPLQITDTSEEEYGTWKLSVDSDVRDDNWREFIGLELIIILERHADKLPSKLVSGIKESLILAAKGANDRNVEPTKTNIAVMSAFLMTYVGKTMNIPEIEETGILKAWSIYIMFNRDDCLSEFNSPTYSGVTMLGLACWRELGPCKEMKAMGAEMEIKLWQNIADFYHAGFRNLGGPFFRTYGMDMTKYNAIIGIWITLVIDDLEKGTILRKNSSHYGELSNLLSAVQVGHCEIESVVESLKSFQKSRFIEKLVPSSLDYFSKRYKVTMWIDEDIMMGGVEGYHRYLLYTKQLKVGTIYWKPRVNESLSWLMVPSQNAQNVEVSETKMKIWRDDDVDTLTFYINGEDIDISDFEKKDWDLPGIKITCSLDPSLLEVKKIDSDVFSSDYAVYHNLSTIIEIKCDTNELELTINHDDGSGNGEVNIMEFLTSPIGLTTLSGILVTMVVAVVLIIKKKKEEGEPT